MIGGCVTFINSKIKNISVDIKKNSCGKGLEVLLSEGVFDKINISSSKLDAFDAEISNLKINNIIVNKADGGECIGVKRGKYIIINSQLKDCGDKAVSAGEHTFLWKYNKDSGVTSGEDAAWIDNIIFPPSYYSAIILGDVNEDGSINIQDVILTVNIILSSLDYNPAGDLNEDGVIDVLDVINIVNLILG